MTFQTSFSTEEQHKLAWERLAQQISLTKDFIQHSPTNTEPQDPGELIIIGSGIQSLGFIQGEEDLIKQADEVFYCVADPATVTWIRTIRPDAYDLYVLYGNHKVRYTTYMQMAEAMLYYVRQGKKVVAIYYGHPGIFALSPHRAIQIAKREGHKAVMKPGVSALDCLFADLNVDPAHPGLQTHEASDLLVRRRVLDTSLHIVLWQVGLIGEMGFRDQGYINQNFPVLIEYLQEIYGKDYPITHYVASRYATIPPLIEVYSLDELYDPNIQIKITGISTFYIAPKEAVQADRKTLERIGMLQPGAAFKPTLQPPLREIGEYGPREMVAFKDFKTFKVPSTYHHWKDTEASRFIVALQKDLHLQKIYEKNPSEALSHFPKLTKTERFLLESRDANNIQAAAKGLTFRSTDNEKFLHDLFTNQKLSSSLLEVLKKKISSEEKQTKLASWAQENGYTPKWSFLYKSFIRMSHERLLLWTGVYVTEDQKHLITIQGSFARLNEGELHVNGKAISKFTFRHGVLKWTPQEGISVYGFLRLDINQKGERRLAGSTWEDKTKNQPSAFFAKEANPGGYPINQLVGFYMYQGKKLEILPPGPNEKERQFPAFFNGKKLEGAVSYQFTPPVISVGEHKFPLAECIPKKNLAPWFYGTYLLRSNKHQLGKITINEGKIELDRESFKASEESNKQLSWTKDSGNYPSGKLHFILDPITLLPCLSGFLQNSSEEKVFCHGMIPESPYNSFLCNNEPLFDLPQKAWLILLEQCKLDSHYGGSFLWANWGKVHTSINIIYQLIEKKKTDN